MPRKTVALTEEEREAKRESQRAMIEQSCRELLTSEGWTRWARTRASFHRYSFGNCMLIAMQAPEAQQVAGFKKWQELGRRVRKGEKAIKILAPMTVKDKDNEEETRVFFRAVPVFDIAQTDGEELPSRPSEPITGESHEPFLALLTAHAVSLGYSVTFEELNPGHGGYCDSKARRIVVSSVGAINAQVCTLVHELAHAHGVSYKDYGREDAEVIVETAAMIVCGSIGLDTGGESIPYIAGWGEAGDLAAIKAHAAVVDEIARKLEQACAV